MRRLSSLLPTQCAAPYLPPTCTQRLTLRTILYAGLGQYISGAIMFEETLYQKARNGQQFVDVLLAQGIYPGIKVDTGLQVRGVAAERQSADEGKKRGGVWRSRGGADWSFGGEEGAVWTGGRAVGEGGKLVAPEPRRTPDGGQEEDWREERFAVLDGWKVEVWGMCSVAL